MVAATYTIEDQQRMSRAVNYFAWQGRLVLPYLGRRVIEVGCGIGNFTKLLLDRDAVLALDSEPDCVERLRMRYAEHENIEAMVCDVESREFSRLHTFGADSCVCLNVLEHVENDGSALAAMASVLVPGGAVVLFVPAFQSLFGPIDRNLGHYRRYGRSSLAALARSVGLEVQVLRYVNFAGFFGWWANARLFRKEAQSSRQIEVFDRFVVPVMSRVEEALPPPFGQSLLAVLRKP